MVTLGRSSDDALVFDNGVHPLPSLYRKRQLLPSGTRHQFRAIAFGKPMIEITGQDYQVR
jgi:hypothetical protein